VPWSDAAIFSDFQRGHQVEVTSRPKFRGKSEPSKVFADPDYLKVDQPKFLMIRISKFSRSAVFVDSTRRTLDLRIFAKYDGK
jgi:hypothetical protein